MLESWTKHRVVISSAIAADQWAGFMDFKNNLMNIFRTEE